MQIDPTVGVIIGTLIGAFSGIAGTVISTNIVQRSQERRQIRELVLTTALENWRHAKEVAIRKADQGTRSTLLPIESFIAPMSKVLEMCDKTDLTPTDVRRIIRESSVIRDAAIDAIIDDHKRRGKEYQ